MPPTYQCDHCRATYVWEGLLSPGARSCFCSDVCHAAGTVLDALTESAPEEDTDIICDWCGGSGRAVMGSDGRDCAACGGYGVV